MQAPVTTILRSIFRNIRTTIPWRMTIFPELSQICNVHKLNPSIFISHFLQYFRDITVVDRIRFHLLHINLWLCLCITQTTQVPCPIPTTTKRKHLINKTNFKDSCLILLLRLLWKHTYNAQEKGFWRRYNYSWGLVSLKPMTFMSLKTSQTPPYLPIMEFP